MAPLPHEREPFPDATTQSAVGSQFRAFLESFPDAVVIVDATGKIVIVNHQTEVLFGYSREQLLGKTVDLLIPAQHHAIHATHLAGYVESPRVRPMGACRDLRGLRKDGTEFSVDISLSPMKFLGDLHIFSTIRDTTLSKQIEDELRRARAELETRVQERTAELAEAVRDLETEIEQHRKTEDELVRERDRAKRYLDIAEVALLALDKSGRILLINRKGLRVLGYGEQELMGQDWFTTCLPKRYRDSARQMFRQILGGHMLEYIEVPAVTKAGEERLIAWHNSLLRDWEGNIVGTLSSGEDITERRRAQEELKRMAAIVESSDDAILSTTLDGAIISWNAAAERLYGYSASEAIGRPFTVLTPPEGAKAVAGLLKKLKRGEHIHGLETVHVTKAGRRINISLTASPVLDDQGHAVACATIVRDITERVRLEQQLRQAHKMEAIGRLAGGVAHDFNNLLGVILGDCELLLADSGLTAPHQKEVEEIHEAGERAASLTRQLLAFSRQEILGRQVLNLNSVLSGFERMLARLAGPEITLQLELTPNLGSVRADPTQLMQVILNLVVNARDAMPYGGTVRIEATNVALDAAYAASNPGVMPGRYVRITVADNGPGMDQETLAHIFEPFFTTKEQGQGSGMGLATAYGIIEQFGGTIRARSEPGTGATFQILLPQVDESTASSAAPQTSEEMPRGTETILVVEDAALLRQVTREFLERVGYTVLTAADGQEALAVSEQHRGGIDLLLTDLVMPGMNGQELSERMLDTRSALKVLYTSGYADSILAERNHSDRPVPFLEKPFTWQALAVKVRTTLDQG